MALLCGEFERLESYRTLRKKLGRSASFSLSVADSVKALLLRSNPSPSDGLLMHVRVRVRVCAGLVLVLHFELFIIRRQGYQTVSE